VANRKSWRPAAINPLPTVPPTANAPPTPKPPSQTLDEWWVEDAARYNRLGQQFVDAGVTVEGPGMDDDLNDDGSLAEGD